jgi:hypothetical protein
VRSDKAGSRILKFNMLRYVLPVLLVSVLPAQTGFEFWPGASYDPAITTIEKVLGHKPGERITSHAGLIGYLETLSKTAPSRMRIFDYGKSWEGRRLVYAAIGSEANIRRLAEIRAGIKKLADPRVTPEPEAKHIMANMPAVVWLGYGVHGNEVSSPDAALLTAYHLLAARNDKMAADIRANVLVLIDPIQNPDGRDRFVHSFEQTVGLEPDPSPLAAEHTEPWPNGRTNHYNFDLNRDWFALTQPETRGRIKALQEWYPHVFVDLHEMGSDSTYYFAPEAVPYNPHLVTEQKDALDWFGKNNARWFDKFGFSYFTREVYDAFYPGYGASWPSYYGSIAMTYEQASARGLVMRRTDERVFHFRDTIRQHFIASLSTCEAAASNRQKLLENFYAYRRTAIEEGSKEPVREYVLVRRGDTSAVDKLALLLAEQGVEVKRASTAFESGGKEIPAGSYLITLAQPAKRLIRTLLDPQVPMSESFLKEQERRRMRKLPDEIYDVTAWSLPLLHNVELVASAQPASVGSELLQAGAAVPGQVIGGKAAVAYVVPWGTAAAGRFLTAALRAGLQLWSTDKPFLQNGRRFPGGTLIIKVAENAAALDGVVERIAKASGAEVHAANSGWVEEGVNFGSRYVVSMRKPAIALAWDYPVGVGSAGHTRYVLERQFQYPVTIIRSRVLATADLSRFQVLILPEAMGDYATAFGPNGGRRLKDWVSAGGTLIGIGNALTYLADPRVDILAIRQENIARPEDAKEKDDKEPEKKQPTVPTVPGAAPPPPETRVPGKILDNESDYLSAIRPESELPDSVAGVLVRANTDPDHWLTAGVAPTLHTLVQGPLIFTPIKLDKGVNAAVFASADQLLASGYLWDENRKQLAWKPLVVVQREGRGVVIGFTADPNFRAYLDGMNVLFLNAVFRGPAHARPAAAQ